MPSRRSQKGPKRRGFWSGSRCSPRADAAVLLHGADCIADFSTATACIRRSRSGILVRNPCFTRSSPCFVQSRLPHAHSSRRSSLAAAPQRAPSPSIPLPRRPADCRRTSCRRTTRSISSPISPPCAVPGSEVVDIKVLAPTDRLVLNALDMVASVGVARGRTGAGGDDYVAAQDRRPLRSRFRMRSRPGRTSSASRSPGASTVSAAAFSRSIIRPHTAASG